MDRPVNDELLLELELVIPEEKSSTNSSEKTNLEKIRELYRKIEILKKIK